MEAIALELAHTRNEDRAPHVPKTRYDVIHIRASKVSLVIPVEA